MDILNSLKQLKNIEPDKDFSRRSLHLILNTAPVQPQRETLRDMIFKSIEFAGAVALAGLLIFLITGGSSNIPSPLQVANFDPATLKAEAHAIDIQVQLVNLDYNLVASAASSTQSTRPVAAPLNAANIAPSASPATETTSSSSSQTSTLSVDQALQQLAK